MLIRLLNMALRVSSLFAKLLLTLYMGRFLSLADIGSFGLAMATVAIAVSVLGCRLTYVSARDLIDVSPEKIVCIVRDQTVFYFLNYAVALVAFVIASAGPLSGSSLHLLIAIFTISLLESFANATMDNLVSLKRPTAANVLLFMRASLWPFPAIVLGILLPEFRNVETLLLFWILGILVALAINFYLWRGLPWRYAKNVPINWKWLRGGIAIAFPIWLGAIGGSAAQYAERFVVEYDLGREFVGIVSFYTSFSGAVFSIIYSSVFTFSFPKLVSHHQKAEYSQFNAEFRSMTLHAMILALVMTLIIAAVVPFLGELIHRPELTDNASTLWLLLVAVWLRCASESVHYILYARHEDRPIWLGYILLLVPAYGLNALLVPYVGLNGVGLSAIGSSVFLGVWRIACVWRSNKRLKGGDAYVV